jgi:dienelactone hydrolase
MRLILIAASAIFVLTGAVMAEIKTETVVYHQAGTPLEGVLVYDAGAPQPLPAVIIFHQWLGITDYERQRARMLAELGYAAFCADIYGQGARPAGRADAGQFAGKYRGDRALMRARAQAALDYVQGLEFVDPAQVAAIGYCFGGGVALELARSGADLAGVVSFHGNLDTPDPVDARNIKCPLLVCHGAADPHVPQRQVQDFVSEMEAAGVDYEVNMYGGAVHSFTDWNAGSDTSGGAAYSESANRRSWDDLLQFFAEIF